MAEVFLNTFQRRSFSIKDVVKSYSEKTVLKTFLCCPLITFSNSLDPGQARQSILARMRACEISYEPSLLERKVLFKAHMYVLNHLAVFVGYFIAVSFPAEMRLCEVSYYPESVIFLFFQ